ncbi:Hypothetical predicted protein [Mytilus galloprovincialis]|nr:Hypothetical predicted protein [Mytilus galloprovincialis]
MGTVKGFKHLATYLRGKEEMVISIVNEPQTQHRVYNTDSRRNSVMEEQVPDPSKSFTSQQLPYDNGRQDECQLCSLILTIVKEIKYSPSLDDQPDNPDQKDCDMISDIKFE